MYILFLQIGSGNFGELSGMVCLIVLLQKLDSGFFPGTDVTYFCFRHCREKRGSLDDRMVQRCPFVEK